MIKNLLKSKTKCYAGTKSETIKKVVLPAALPGIVAALKAKILAAGLSIPQLVGTAWASAETVVAETCVASVASDPRQATIWSGRISTSGASYKARSSGAV